jgi:CheY-like chemotaxis protein
VRKRLSFDPRITPLVENAIQGAERGASLTQRMLAFARRQELDVKPVDIALLVNGMTDLMQRSLGPSYSVEIDVPSSLPPAFTDSNQLAAAILNLAVNARDAMPHGGSIRIRGRRSTVEAPGNGPLVAGTYVRLAVIDEGEGMDAETLARATEPFFTTKGVGKGTGLGLSMVHGVAAQSGGQLLLKSVPHEGTTVEIWLPVATVADDASSPTPITDALASTSDLDCPRAILVVDDDALVRMNMVVMLEDLGHRVSEAASARLALEILERGEAFDLVITDHAMPGVTGADLADQIQARWPRLPVVLATGYAELPPGVRTGRPRLTKPFSQDELGGIVKSVLSEAFNQESD